jgi:hypothetical protein
MSMQISAAWAQRRAGPLADPRALPSRQPPDLYFGAAPHLHRRQSPGRRLMARRPASTSTEPGAAGDRDPERPFVKEGRQPLDQRFAQCFW